MFSTIWMILFSHVRPFRIHGAGVQVRKVVRAASSVDEISPPPAEVFSVAPMMGHTNRHYRYFFRLISRKAWLHTEMMPASTILNAASVSELLRFHPLEWPVSLQLGGTDPDQLAKAAGIAAKMGYAAINLNCGCPSTAVSGSGRKGGAAMMLDAQHVAACCRAMEESIASAGKEDPHISSLHLPIVTVKHRLGVVNAAHYDPLEDKDDSGDYDSAKSFIEAIAGSSGVRRFHVHARKAVLGREVTDYLGSGSKRDDDDDDDEQEKDASDEVRLWTPSCRREMNGATVNDSGEEQIGGGTPRPFSKSDLLSMPVTSPTGERVKINHKRVQYKAKKISRSVTIANRFVPPLRRHLVGRLAREIKSPDKKKLELVGNGGLESLADIEKLIAGGASGGMVGRAAINHPCAFAGVDRVLFQGGSVVGDSPVCRTRGDVLSTYIAYVEEEEARVAEWAAAHPHLLPSSWWNEMQLAARRKELVAPAFNLFAGEEGCEGFRRRLRKLTGRRKSGERFSASGVLKAALMEVPPQVLYKRLGDALRVDELSPQYAGAPRRSGPMHITVS